MVANAEEWLGPHMKNVLEGGPRAPISDSVAEGNSSLCGKRISFTVEAELMQTIEQCVRACARARVLARTPAASAKIEHLC
jgi:hypothetical protein